VLNRIADRIERSSRFCHGKTIDNGKPIRETMAADLHCGGSFPLFRGCVRAQEGSIGEMTTHGCVSFPRAVAWWARYTVELPAADGGVEAGPAIARATASC